MKLSGNTILITGGGTGIGKALAKQLHKLGNEVLITGRREHRLKEVQAECPGIHIKRSDINSDADRRELLALVKSKFPKLNILFNNGASQRNYDLKLGIDGLAGAEEEISIALTAPILLTGYFIPLLAAQQHPAIVNVTSVLGMTPLTPIPIYCAAKAGFHVYSMLLRKHLEGTPIKVFEAPPPKVETELNSEGRKHSGAVMGPKGLEADDYAAYIIDCLGKDQLNAYYPPMDEMYRKPRCETEPSRIK